MHAFVEQSTVIIYQYYQYDKTIIFYPNNSTNKYEIIKLS